MSIRRYTPLLVLIAAVALVTPMISGSASDLDTSLFIATTAIIATSLGLAYGEGGVLSMAQASFGAIGGYTVALITRDHDVAGWMTLPLAVIVPALIGFVLARAIVRLSPLALAFATLTLGQVIAIVVEQGGDLTGGYIGVGGIPGLSLGATPYRAHLLAWAILAVVVLIWIAVKHSMQGVALRHVRHDPILAASLGIAVEARLSALFGLCAGMAGVGGWLYAYTRNYLAPESLGLVLSINAVIFVIVGGKRHVLGPTVGATVLILIRDQLPSADVGGMFFGGALIVSLIIAPSGLMSLFGRRGLDRVVGRLRRTSREPHLPREPLARVPEQTTLERTPVASGEPS